MKNHLANFSASWANAADFFDSPKASKVRLGRLWAALRGWAGEFLHEPV